LRLAMTTVAGLVIGLNRSEHGRPAGVRTTLLVCLAASLSMLLANRLMGLRGKVPDSFVNADVMRLPLGILSGMGFIGAGAILRKDNLVVGITTAATLWFVTVLGLCFGAGEIGLGIVSLALAWVTLSGLKYLERRMSQDLRGTLFLVVGDDGPPDEQLRERIEQSACRLLSWGVCVDKEKHRRELTGEIQWRDAFGQTKPPAIVQTLMGEPAVSQIRWQPQGISSEFYESK
jgi:putative Mg2+ transporter-C (MgtC) family protein